MKKLCQFLLLAGALLQDIVNWDNDLLCSNANITDDLALYHLKTNPNCRELFQELPENVDELVEAFVLPGEKKSENESQKAEITSEEKFKEDAKDSTEDVTKEDATPDVGAQKLPENVDELPKKK
ncbi:MAG: hypothetical protein WCH34_16395 [Bacteroidota bacterium]